MLLKTFLIMAHLRSASLQDVLHLTWWPLARDCSYYCISLLTLAMLFGKISNKPVGEDDAWLKYENFCYWRDDGVFAKPQDCAAIYAWEAGLLFSMYFGYCLVMANNRALSTWLDEKAGKKEAAAATDDVVQNPAADNGTGSQSALERAKAKAAKVQADITGEHILQHTSAYRAGLWSMMMEERSLSEQAELHLVSHVSGNVSTRRNPPQFIPKGLP